MTSGKQAHQGFSMVEMMVAITLGLMVLGSISLIFLQSLKSRSNIEQVQQQTDNGTYALQVLTEDLRHAGYLAEFNSRLLTIPSVKPEPCTTDSGTLATGLALPIQGYDNGNNAPSCLSDVLPGTDILLVRRAGTCATGSTGCDSQVNGNLYFQASACSNSSELGSSNAGNYFVLSSDSTQFVLHKKSCLVNDYAPIYPYRTHIYFIAANDKAGDGIPTLKRAELGLVGGALGWTIVPIAEGIENLQIEYGLDNPTTPTGTPVAYTPDPDAYNSCSATSTPTCSAYWANVVSAKLHLLVRNTQATTGYSSSKTYTLGRNSAGTPLSVGPFSDSYRRQVYASAVRLNNVAGRNSQ